MQRASSTMPTPYEVSIDDEEDVDDVANDAGVGTALVSVSSTNQGGGAIVEASAARMNAAGGGAGFFNMLSTIKQELSVAGDANHEIKNLREEIRDRDTEVRILKQYIDSLRDFVPVEKTQDIEGILKKKRREMEQAHELQKMRAEYRKLNIQLECYIAKQDDLVKRAERFGFTREDLACSGALKKTVYPDLNTAFDMMRPSDMHPSDMPPSDMPSDDMPTSDMPSDGMRPSDMRSSIGGVARGPGIAFISDKDLSKIVFQYQ